MPVTLLAQQQFPLEEVASWLRLEGVEAAVCSWEKSLHTIAPPQSGDHAVLIVPEQGVIKLGERTKEARKRLGGSRLIVCGPQLMNEDRGIIHKCGADAIITPHSWSPEHVAERIYAELVLDTVELYRFGLLRGAARRMRELYRDIEQIAPLNETVLILGETGTGKELVAREIHRSSLRKGDMLPLNCAEFTPDLLASELFGHEQGAFTDARHARKGLIWEAGQGTLFLDEIGELDLQSQAKLLRVLQERKFRSVGSDKFQEFRARLVLATNRNLEEATDEGRFRRDLLERINSFTLELPPLRERRADIPLLVQHFIEEYEQEYPGKRLKIPPGALDCLFQADWPGNVRQLRKEVRRAAAYADQAGNISSIRLQEAARRIEKRTARHSIFFDPAADTWRTLQRRVQNIYFRALLAYTQNNKEAAIRISGLSRSQFYERLKEMDKDDASEQSS